VGRDAEAVQREVRRCREELLGGRGPGASPAELAAHQRDRPLLGALPAAAERELAAVQTAAARGVDPAQLAAALERVRHTLG
jgi:hypothetical protein